MDKDNQQTPLLPDKAIPTSVMIIGTFEIAVALWGLIILVLVGQFEGISIALFVLLIIYGTMGAGLWAIQEWARASNVILHIIAVPYTFYAAMFLEGPSGWQLAIQLIISLAIVFFLTRPAIQYKFQTAVPKRKKGS